MIIALNLLYYLEIGRKKSPKAIHAKQYELGIQNNGYKSENSTRMTMDHFTVVVLVSWPLVESRLEVTML